MTMRKFSSTGRTAEVTNFQEAEPVTFMIDEDEYTAYPPKTSQLAMFMVTQAKNREISDNIAGIVDFLDGLLEEADQKKLRERLLDRNDPLDFEIVEQVVEMLMEEWMERPTQAASDSSGLPQKAVKRSTGKQPSMA